MNWKNNFKLNLNFLVDQTKKKQGEVAIEIGIKVSTFNNYLAGVSNPTLDGLIQISKYFGVSESSLLHTVMGQMKVSEPEPEQYGLRRDVEDLKKRVAELERRLEQK